MAKKYDKDEAEAVKKSLQQHPGPKKAKPRRDQLSELDSWLKSQNGSSDSLGVGAQKHLLGADLPSRKIDAASELDGLSRGIAGMRMASTMAPKDNEMLDTAHLAAMRGDQTVNPDAIVNGQTQQMRAATPVDPSIVGQGKDQTIQPDQILNPTAAELPEDLTSGNPRIRTFY